MPDSEEDEGSAQDEGKHVAESSEGEHPWSVFKFPKMTEDQKKRSEIVT